VDALRIEPHPTHMNVSEALALVDEVKPGQTWFTHLCHDLMHAELEPSLPKGVRIAYDGLKIEL
jgi:phosphoribosyl 1,2-cyclic phosphate phosphodiesterase